MVGCVEGMKFSLRAAKSPCLTKKSILNVTKVTLASEPSNSSVKFTGLETSTYKDIL